jgi:hypothetical protein
MGLLSIEGFEKYFKSEDTPTARENPHFFGVGI